MVKNLPAMWEIQVQTLGGEDPLEKGMETHSCTPAWRIPWTEELGRLQSMGSQRARHDSATEQQQPDKYTMSMIEETKNGVYGNPSYYLLNFLW